MKTIINSITTNIFWFTCFLFFMELLLGTTLLWVMLEWFRMDSSWHTGNWLKAKSVLAAHFIQLCFRYVLLNPVFSWHVLKRTKDGFVEKAMLNFLVVSLDMLVLGIIMPVAWRILLLQSEVAYGLSIWFEVAITSLLMALVYQQASSYQQQSRN